LLVIQKEAQKKYSIGSALVSDFDRNHLYDGFSPFCRVSVVFAPNGEQFVIS